MARNSVLLSFGRDGMCYALFYFLSFLSIETMFCFTGQQWTIDNFLAFVDHMSYSADT